jgi:hypothetical protein
MKIRLIPNRPIYINMFGQVLAYTFISAVPFFGEQQLRVRERFGGRNVVNLTTINGYVSNRLEYNVLTRRGEIPVSARICKTPRSAAKAREIIGDARKRPTIELITTDPSHDKIKDLLKAVTANINKDLEARATGCTNMSVQEMNSVRIMQEMRIPQSHESERIMREMLAAPRSPELSRVLWDTSFSINKPTDIIKVKGSL